MPCSGDFPRIFRAFFFLCSLLRQLVHCADVAVVDGDVLRSVAGIFLLTLTDLNALDEGSQDLRRQFVDGFVLLRLVDKPGDIADAVPKGLLLVLRRLCCRISCTIF